MSSVGLLLLLVAALLCGVSISAGAAPWSQLYGLSPRVQLQKLNPKTAAVLEETDSLAYEAQGQGLGTIDTTEGVYYFVGTNVSSQTISLVGISGASGRITTEIELPLELEMLVGVGQFCDYDVLNKDVIVVGRDRLLKNQHAMLRVNPKSGAIKTLSKIGDFSPLDLLGGTSFFDAVANMEWFQLPINNSGSIVIRFYGYSGDSGTLLNILDNPLNFVNLAFDRTTGLAYGVGARLEPNTGQIIRVLGSFDSSTGVSKPIADLPGNYVVMMGSIGTMDEENGLLYSFILKGNSTYSTPVGSSMPDDVRVGVHKWLPNSLTQDDAGHPLEDIPGMNLVAIDVKTGKIVSSPKACDQFPDCSWNLEYLNQD